MQDKTWKVGELSKLTGITVRTLHHYDDIGLLTPSEHTGSGHRLYSETDIIKLQQIISLKQLDFSLEEIKELFDNPQYDPSEVVKMQLERLDEEIKMKMELRKQLNELEQVFNTWEKSTPEQFIKAIQLIMGSGKYFSEEQRDKFKNGFGKLKQTGLKELSERWNQLIASLQAEMEKGTSVDSPVVRELAKSWQEGINMFTGGDKGLIQSAEQYYRDNPYASMGSGISGELYDYIKRALSKL